MKVIVRNRFNNNVIIDGEFDSVVDAVESARANLREAYLTGAWVRGKK